jgi:tripartite ATP-independent transporter DctM subunit
MIWWITVFMIVMIAVRVPIAVALGVSGVSYILITDGPMVVAPQRVMSTLNNALLLALPMFMLGGRLMNLIGATQRVFNLALAIIGHIRGGLGYVVVLTSIIFSAMSGSAAADAVGVGTITVRVMRENGYDPNFAAAVTLGASTLAPIIPPSIILIIYSVTANASIGQLFLAGVLPGLFIGGALMVTVGIISHRRRFPIAGNFSWKRLFGAVQGAFLPLMTPVIILGGIFSGIFTPTEAAVVAVDYMLLLGLFYRNIKWKDFYYEVVRVGTTIGALMLIISISGLTGWVYAREQLPLHLTGLVTSLTSDPSLVMLIIIFVGLVLGMFMDAVPIILILVPALLPLIGAVGIDPVHFGLLFAITTVIGLITPPVGICLYGVAAVARLSIEQVFRATLPFFLALVLAICALVFMPGFVLFLPNMLF